MGKGKVGTFDVELMEDFLGAFATAGGATLHVEIRAGRNYHHIIEATFKAFARALTAACRLEPGLAGTLPTTKGLL